MIGNYPITWIAAEVLAIVLFSLCMIHAVRQPDYKQRIFELCCFVLGAVIFEHVGVLFTQTYSYNQNRIFMAGVLSMTILMVEAVTVYTGMILFDHMKLPKWMGFFVVGFWCMLIDCGIDPVYVNDTYLIDGVMSGQWNWNYRYDITFFGIPFFNFTGWLVWTGVYACMVYICRKQFQKKGKKWFGILNFAHEIKGSLALARLPRK